MTVLPPPVLFPSAAPLGPPIVHEPAGLYWWPGHGMGYYPVTAGAAPYDQAYWDKYVAMDATPMGEQLTQARVEMVARWWSGHVIDVGIGAGAFVRARNLAGRITSGWDVNPIALEHLGAIAVDPLTAPDSMALTFWDCLEHIPEPDAMLRRAAWVFCSLPIFTGPEHVLRSRHFRKDEHCWYWTQAGLIGWMRRRGFVCHEWNTMETLLGREDIGSFAFERVDP